jgi:hypothetical protein
VIEHAKQMIRSGERASPVFFLKHSDRVAVITLNLLEDKDQWSSLMRFIIHNTNPEEYLFLGESWIKKFNPENIDDKLAGELTRMGMKQVHEFDDKEEGIVLVHGTREKTERTGLIPFKRTDKGVQFSKLEWLPDAIEGRLVNLWNPLKGDSHVN